MTDLMMQYRAQIEALDAETRKAAAHTVRPDGRVQFKTAGFTLALDGVPVAPPARRTVTPASPDTGQVRYREVPPHEVDDVVRRAGEVALEMVAEDLDLGPRVTLRWCSRLDAFDWAELQAAERKGQAPPWKTWVSEAWEWGSVYPLEPDVMNIVVTSDVRRIFAMVAHEATHVKQFRHLNYAKAGEWDREGMEREANEYGNQIARWYDATRGRGN